MITNFITKLLDNKPLTIYGDGEQTRDFVFVGDVVDNLIHAMGILKRDAHVINICTGSRTTINELVDLLSTGCEKKYVKINEPARVDDARDSFGSQEKMRSYGFKINHDISEGLIETVDYFMSLRK